MLSTEGEIDLAELRGAHCANDDLEQFVVPEHVDVLCGGAIIVAPFVPRFFALCFGEDWRNAGDFAGVLLIPAITYIRFLDVSSGLEEVPQGCGD